MESKIRRLQISFYSTIALGVLALFTALMAGGRADPVYY